jgi:arylformamidase
MMLAKSIKMNKHKYISLSHWIDELSPTYANQGGFKRESLSSIKKGRTANSEFWKFNNHIGTHIDYPKHFNDSGKSSSDFIDSFFIFKKIGLIFLDKTPEPNQSIDYKLLKNKLENLNNDVEIIILKTGFEKFRNSKTYWNNNPSFDCDIPLNLKKRFSNLKVFGFDTISLTSINDREMGKKAHLEFLKKDPTVLIIEDMRLSLLEKSYFPLELYIFPLMIKDADGSPVNCSLKIK